MSTQNEPKNFFDSRTIVAVALVGLLFFGWQKYLEKKYPDFYTKQSVQKTIPAPQGQALPGTPATTPGVAGSEAFAQTGVSTSAVEVAETHLDMQTATGTFKVSSKGMGLQDWTLNGFTDREKKPVLIGAGSALGVFAVGLSDTGKPLDFQLSKVSENVIKGVALIGATQVEQTLTYVHETGALSSTINVTGVTSAFKGLTVSLRERKYHEPDGTFFLPSIDHQEFVVRHDGKVQRVTAGSKKAAVDESFANVGMVAIGSQYFTSAILDKSEIIPSVQVQAPIEGELAANLTYKPSPAQDSMVLQWIGYGGPKDIDRLQKIDPLMSEVVNFGFFSPIAKVLLAVLKLFHGFIGNWGVAIILLTLLVRALVLPFNITSYKSMKRMQMIQPKLQSLRDRYKDDPASLNRETMAMMKNEKVNPIGGCLPMLLQMPIFFALYQALGQSIELYQAPFVFWIHDLSLKDPFFILPILMGITMFIQQKITPTTMDPAQAKILQWMPVIFSVFTLTLPAGLTLYIFVSTLFGVTQQRLFMRDKSAAVSATTVATAR